MYPVSSSFKIPIQGVSCPWKMEFWEVEIHIVNIYESCLNLQILENAFLVYLSKVMKQQVSGNFPAQV